VTELDRANARHTPDEVWMILAALAAISLILLLEPFLLPLAMAAVIAVLVDPAYNWCVARLGRPSLVASFMTIGLIGLVVLPTVGLIGALMSNIEESIDAGADILSSETWAMVGQSGPIKLASGFVGIEASEMPAAIGEKLREQAGPIAQQSVRFVSGFGGGLVDLGIMIFSLFFLLRDGRAFVDRVVWLAPIDRDRSWSLVKNARDTIFATVYGNVGVAIVQGILVGVAFVVADLPSPALWGVVAGFLSLAPLVGAAVIWAPACVILMVQGQVLSGVLMLGYGVGVISTVDNYVRALIVGGTVELHSLAVFLSVLGGVALFGAAGVFLGPVLFVIAVSVIEMSREALDQQSEAGVAPESSIGEPVDETE
jgi:predicted PurR-regulated permease PerM